MIQDALDELDPEREADLADTTVLLASELCENAVLHAGTEFEVTVTITDDEVTVAVTDRGAGPLELHLAQPRQRYGRAASHGRGLALVQRLPPPPGPRPPGGPPPRVRRPTRHLVLAQQWSRHGRPADPARPARHGARV